MQLGAHEAMEIHEILMEKINVITHFNLYAQEARNPQLRDMIMRHQQEEILAYNELEGMTRGNNRFNPIPPNTNIRGISNQQIQYGLNNPSQYSPQADAKLSDSEIATAMLMCHKNMARNASWAALECADPNIRRTLMNSYANCTNQAYEVFLFMNEQGDYQVPTLNSQTTEAFLHSYQPAGASLQEQYDVPATVNTGYTGQSQYGGTNYSSMNVGGSDGTWSVDSRDSVLYGANYGGEASQSTWRSNSVNNDVNLHNDMRH